MYILETFSTGPVDTQGILLGCPLTKKAALIDAPFGGSAPRIQCAKKLGLSIELLLLTHSHWDHIAEAALLKKELGISIYLHPEDAQNLRDPGSDGLPLLETFEGTEPDHLLLDGEKIQLGELQIEVIHTPGHTPGGVCFYLAKEELLVSGDTLFRGAIGNLSFPTGEPERMWQSLAHLAKLPPETRVIPGHGKETTIGRELRGD